MFPWNEIFISAHAFLSLVLLFYCILHLTQKHIEDRPCLSNQWQIQPSLCFLCSSFSICLWVVMQTLTRGGLSLIWGGRGRKFFILTSSPVGFFLIYLLYFLHYMFVELLFQSPFFLLIIILCCSEPGREEECSVENNLQQFTVTHLVWRVEKIEAKW